MIFRIYHRLLGGHVHCRLFAGKHEGALGKCGEFCMREEEFAAFRDVGQSFEYIDFDPSIRLAPKPVIVESEWNPK